MVSRRAQRLVQNPSPLVVAHFACVKDPYDAKTNPQGYVNFGTAENHLLWDLVGPRLAASRDIDESDVHYAPLYGTQPFREAVARHMAALSGAPVSGENLVVASGASAVLDILAYALCEPGEAILVPAPFYSGFKVALGARAEAKLVPAPLSSADGFALRVDALERALAQARAEGLAVKAVLVTSPQNPLGRAHTASTLRDVIAFAQREGLHAVFDEIYMGSAFAAPVESALGHRDLAPGRVHVVYGFAKDFGLSGMKVGILHTDDPALLAACKELAYLAPVSTDTQAALVRMLADDAWRARLLEENRRRLAESYGRLADLLRRHDIPHLPADAGVFAWLDLRAFLETPTFDAEAALHARILEEARVNVTPGIAFASPEPGWFRLCYAQDPEHVREGVERLGRVLGPRRLT